MTYPLSQITKRRIYPFKEKNPTLNLIPKSRKEQQLIPNYKHIITCDRLAVKPIFVFSYSHRYAPNAFRSFKCCFHIIESEFGCGLDESLADIAKDMNISITMVAKHRNKAFELMRKRLKQMTSRKKRIVPPADIILGLINNEPLADIKTLNSYEAYIVSAAKESRYNEFIGVETNEGLAQELRVALYRSLPKLRQVFLGIWQQTNSCYDVKGNKEL